MGDNFSNFAAPVSPFTSNSDNSLASKTNGKDAVINIGMPVHIVPAGKSSGFTLQLTQYTTTRLLYPDNNRASVLISSNVSVVIGSLESLMMNGATPSDTTVIGGFIIPPNIVVPIVTTSELYVTALQAGYVSAFYTSNIPPVLSS